MKDVQMPKTIVLEAEIHSIDSAQRKGLREAQDAYTALHQIEDLGEVPEPVKCTQEWIINFAEEKKKAIRNADFLTASQRQSQGVHFGRLSAKAIGLVSTIQDFLASVPSDQYVYDSQIANFHLRDIDELVRSRCTRDVPPEASVHYSLIRNIDEAIKSLRKWEKQQDVKKLPLKHLLSLPSDGIAAMWATRDIRIDHKYDHLPHVVENRELEEKEIL